MKGEIIMLNKDDILLAFGSSLKAYVVADEGSDEERLFEALADAYSDYASSQDWETDIMRIIAKIYLEGDC
jgi:hypothetical protein